MMKEYLILIILNLYNLVMSFLESSLKEVDGKGSSNAVGHTGLVEVNKI